MHFRFSHACNGLLTVKYRTYILLRMPRSSHWLRLLFLILFSCRFLCSQSASDWKVKPEWVQAHEMFLASDAMRGRGSATPDEWIAATYVASEYQKYGLKPGLPDGTYIQRGELVQPDITAPAQITDPQSRGFGALEEGRDFSLVRTTGESISGPLQTIKAEGVASAQVRGGAIVLLAGNFGAQARSFMMRAYGAGAKAVFREDSSLNADVLERNLREKRAVDPHLPNIASSIGAYFTILGITKAAAGRLQKLPDGTVLVVRINAKDTSRYTYNAVGVLPGVDTSADSKIILLSAHL